MFLSSICFLVAAANPTEYSTNELVLLTIEDGGLMQCLCRASSSDGLFTEEVEFADCSEEKISKSCSWSIVPDNSIRSSVDGHCLEFLEANASPGFITSRCETPLISTQEWKLPSLSSGMLYGSTAWNGGKKLSIFRLDKAAASMHDFMRLNDFQQLMLPSLAKSMAEVQTIQAVNEQESGEISAILESIRNVTNEIHNELNNKINHSGIGVLVEIFESSTSGKAESSFLSPVFEISPMSFAAAGASPYEPSTIVISGYVVAPTTGNYTFVVSNAASDFELKANGRTILEKWASEPEVHHESEPISAEGSEEIQLFAKTSSVLKFPSFRLQWKINDGAEEDISPSDLYPSATEPICGAIMRIKLDCTTTFKQLKEISGESLPSYQVNCPPACLSINKPKTKVFGAPTCYALHSSVCIAAIHSGVSGEKGGTFLVGTYKGKEKGQYPATEAFLFTSGEAPPTTDGECGVVSMILSQGGPIGLGKLKSFAVPELLSVKDGSVVPDYTGITAILTSGMTNVLGGTTTNGKFFLTSVEMTCGGDSQPLNEYDETLHVADGVDVSYKLSSSSKDSRITDIFLTVNSPEQENNGEWQRYSCKFGKDNYGLYYKIASNDKVEYDYPSLSLNCDDTFDGSLSHIQSNYNIRCPMSCFLDSSPVFGLFTYSGKSSVCRSAIHAGVVADAGGVVTVVKLPFNQVVDWSSDRNKIVSHISKEVGAVYYVNVPMGQTCVYPEHPNGLSHIPVENISKYEAAMSFHQVLPSDESVIDNFMSSLINGADDIDGISEFVTDKVETLVNKRMKELDQGIIDLEEELRKNQKPTLIKYLEFDTGDIHKNWVVLDTIGGASGGPSNWKYDDFQGMQCITQKSPIKGNNNIGTKLLLKKSYYNTGFIVAKVYLSTGQAKSSLGFVIKHESESNYIGVEFTVDVADIKGQFFQVKDGIKGYPKVETKPITPGWKLVGVQFSDTSARLSIDGETTVEFVFPINLTSESGHAAVGFFTNGISNTAGFSDVSAGPIADISLYPSLFPVSSSLPPESPSSDGDKIDPILQYISSQQSNEAKVEKSNSSDLLGIECFSNYTDSFKTKDAWIEKPTQGGWFIKNGEVTTSGKPMQLLLSKTTCINRTSLTLEVDINVEQPESAGGLVLRYASPDDMVAAILESSKEGGGVQLTLMKRFRNGDTIQVSKMSSETLQRLNTDLWYRLRVRDASDYIEIFVDNRITMQHHLYGNMDDKQHGLTHESGIIAFRNFRLNSTSI